MWKRERKEERKILWAPWRMSYVSQCDKGEGCLFCRTSRDTKDRENLIVWRGNTCFIILNRFPYNNGHLMVVPYRHLATLDALSHDEKIESWDLILAAQEAIDRTMHPRGYNIGMNLGRVAGAGIVDHLHIHLVPRWEGDTNFMPILGHAKVVSEGLDQTWEKLRAVFESYFDHQTDKR